MSRTNPKGKYCLKFKIRHPYGNITTTKFYPIRSDRDREADRIRTTFGKRIIWLRVKDR